MSLTRLATPGGTKLDGSSNSVVAFNSQKVTLKETFLTNFKVLTPIANGTLPDPAHVMEASPTKRLIVGLSGVSCGGKTTIAKTLQTWLGDKFGDLIMQDDYYKPPETLPINPITNFPEFDEPEAIRMDKIIKDICKWKNQKVDENDETRVLVVEGTMIFTNLAIAKLCDLRYNIHVDFKTAEYRRSLRNYPIPDPPLVMAKNIWPKYIKHREITAHLAKTNGYIFRQIDGTVPVKHTLAGIIQDVRVNKHC